MKTSLIFLSRVSSEFGNFCRGVCGQFNSTEFTPYVSLRDQCQDVPIHDDSVEVGITTLKKLVGWIHRCEACFHFVGCQSGTTAKYPGDFSTGVTSTFQTLGLGSEKAEMLNRQIGRFEDEVGYSPDYVQLEYLLAIVLLGRENILIFWSQESVDLPDERQKKYRAWLEKEGKEEGVSGIEKIVASRDVFVTEIERRLLRIKSAVLVTMVQNPSGEDLIKKLAGLAMVLKDPFSASVVGEKIQDDFRSTVLESLSESIRWIEEKPVEVISRTVWRFGEETTKGWCIFFDDKVSLYIRGKGIGFWSSQATLHRDARLRAVCMVGQDCWMLLEDQNGSSNYHMASLDRDGDLIEYDLVGFSPTGLESLNLHAVAGAPREFVISQLDQIWKVLVNDRGEVQVFSNIEPAMHAEAGCLVGRPLLEARGDLDLEINDRFFGGFEILDCGGHDDSRFLLRGTAEQTAIVSLSAPMAIASLFKIYDQVFPSVSFGAVETSNMFGWLNLVSMNGTKVGKIFLGRTTSDRHGERSLDGEIPPALRESICPKGKQQCSTKTLSMRGTEFYFLRTAVEEPSGDHTRIVAWAIPEKFSERLIKRMNEMILGMGLYPQQITGVRQNLPSTDSWWGELLGVEK